MGVRKKWKDFEIQYIKDNYSSMTLTQMSQETGISQKQLSRKSLEMIQQGLITEKQVVRKEKVISTKRKKHNILTSWDIKDGGCTIAHISMCIEEDFNQSIEQLAQRFSESKDCTYDEALKVLSELNKQGRLIYYDKEMVARVWQRGG